MYEKPISFDANKMKWLEIENVEDYQLLQEKQATIDNLKNSNNLHPKDLVYISESQEEINSELGSILEKNGYQARVKETDFVFISWILEWLPIGIIGLLLAVIFSAAMSSTAAELNALATTTMVDFYQRLKKSKGSESAYYVRMSKWFTLAWGILAIAFASVASMFDNLVEFVNILGSLFYGTVLGIFIVALFLKRIGSNAVLISAIIAQTFIFFVHFAKDWINSITHTELSFLWYNFIACAIVVSLSLLISSFSKRTKGA
jgi:Na+/proline symporter